jgi:hypothetical protein
MSTLQVTNLSIQTVNAEIMISNSVAVSSNITINSVSVATTTQVADEATALSIALG